MTTRGRTLPTEIIVSIFEWAIEKHPWQIETLVNVNRHLRSVFINKLCQKLHLRSMQQFDSLITQGWPRLPQQQHALSLYLHFLYRMDDEDVFYEELLDRIEDIPSPAREQIQTLGIRTLPSNKAFTSLGIWTCNMLPNVTRLYVDSSLLPPFGDGETSEELLARMEQPVAPKPGNPDELSFKLFTAPSKIKAFALAGSSLMGTFGHVEGLHGQRQFIKTTFPDIERLYLFTMAWQQDGTDMHDQLDRVAYDFDAVTGVKLIVNIVIQGAEPASWCATQASVFGYPNGSMAIKSIVVDQMQGNQEYVARLYKSWRRASTNTCLSLYRSVLALMHRIVDDIDAEWAPDAFTGYRWPPSTRPRYTVGIPSRSTLKREGVELPRRCR